MLFPICRIIGAPALVIALSLVSLHSEVATFNPVADTTLIQVDPNANLGGANFFNAGTAGNGNRNRALLAQIADTHPSSLHELAATTGRTPGNLSRTLKTMERYGLVRLHKGERGKICPELVYRDVQLVMTLS